MSAVIRRAPVFMFSWCRHLASEISSLPPNDIIPLAEQRPAAAAPDTDPERTRRRSILTRLAPCFNNAEEGPSKFPRLPGGAQAPWTPTSQLAKRKTYKTRSQHMLQTLRSEYSAQVSEEKTFPPFRAGDILEVDLVVPENDLRRSTFTGICMGIKNNGPMTRFRMRNTIKGTGPVERSFLLYSPFVKNIKVKRSLPVRRAKLTYLRKRRDAESTFK